MLLALPYQQSLADLETLYDASQKGFQGELELSRAYSDTDIFPGTCGS